MELTVLPDRKDEQPWYGAGLRFTCTQCGNCCTGGPGYVWASPKEIARLAEFLNLTPKKVIEKYCRWVGTRLSFKETCNSRGEYDCIFLTEEKSTAKNGVVHTKRGCSIYPVRPLQCRTWPFWDGNLQSPKRWQSAAERCHGMNFGSRIFSPGEIEKIRDARDWPKKPPTSASA